jgi:hypothetical protein
VCKGLPIPVFTETEEQMDDQGKHKQDGHSEKELEDLFSMIIN